MSQTINNYVVECPELADHFDYNNLITAVTDCELSVGLQTTGKNCVSNINIF